MTRVPNAMRDYYVAWTERILEDGRFRPAYYAHTHNAQQIYDDVRAVFDRRGIEAEPPFWIAGGKDFERDRHPIDVNVAAVPSPSSAELAD